MNLIEFMWPENQFLLTSKICSSCLYAFTISDKIQAAEVHTCVQYCVKYPGTCVKSPSRHPWDSGKTQLEMYLISRPGKISLCSNVLREYSYIPIKTEVTFISKRCLAFTSSFSREGWRRLEACCCQESEHGHGSINGSQPEDKQNTSHVPHVWRLHWNAVYIPKYFIMQL